MGTLQIVLGSLLLVFCVLIILVIILQEGHQQGLGVITGAADSFFSKNKARSWDSFLSRWTKFFAFGFVLFVIALDVIAYFW
ncbi:MAG: preprotein translocase subunit SecG [Ruminococcus sp.]|nr:preprotein translocase subunit SecG [Ruminococcus sp.]